MSVIETKLDSPLGDYYLDRVRIHMDDSYAGLRMRKFPEDLRVLEHLLWEGQYNVVLEIGLGHGGSALWFRDRLRTLVAYRRIQNPLVIAVDRTIEQAHEHLARADPDYAGQIKLVESDIRDHTVVEKVARHLPAGARVLVIDDSAHLYETTMATLTYFSPLVPPDGHLLIEDGHRDLPNMLPAEVPGTARGVLPAIRDWLRTEAGARFEQQRHLERYIVTSNPGGWLRRVR